MKLFTDGGLVKLSESLGRIGPHSVRPVVAGFSHSALLIIDQIGYLLVDSELAIEAVAPDLCKPPPTPIPNFNFSSYLGKGRSWPIRPNY